MTDVEKLTALRAMVGGSDTDEVLSTYLMLAGRKVIARAFPYHDDVTEVPVKYETIQLRGKLLTPKMAFLVPTRTPTFLRLCSRALPLMWG